MNKSLIVAIVVIVLVAGGFFYWQQSASSSIRQTVLNQLHQNAELCSVQKENINVFSGTGDFWMSCNGRPYFAQYSDGKLNAPLNGWSWLNSTSYWNELKDCDVYYPQGSLLAFYCPYTLNTSDAVVKYFSVTDFSISKVKEEKFTDVFTSDLKSVVDFSNCNLSGFSSGFPKTLAVLMNFSCPDGQYNLASDLGVILPVISSDSSEKSFEKFFGVTPTVNGQKASYDFGMWSVEVTYPINNDPTEINLNFTLKDESALKSIMNKFIPDLQNIAHIQLINTKIGGLPNTSIKQYLVNDGIIVNTYFIGNNLFTVHRVRDGFYGN